MSYNLIDRYFSGQGELLASFLDANNKPTGYFPLGNVTELKIAQAVTNQQHKESRSGNRAVDRNLTTETKVTASWTMENVNKENAAIATRGNVVTKAGATVTGEAAKVRAGKIVPLANMKVSAVTVKKGATTLVAYVAGTASAADGQWDYKLNAEHGSLEFPKTGSFKTVAVVDLDDLTVDYTYASQNVVHAMTQGGQNLALRFEGLNTAEGNEPVLIDIFIVQPDPMKELAVISDNYAQFAVEAPVTPDTSKPAGESQFYSVRGLS